MVHSLTGLGDLAILDPGKPDRAARIIASGRVIELPIIEVISNPVPNPAIRSARADIPLVRFKYSSPKGDGAQTGHGRTRVLCIPSLRAFAQIKRPSRKTPSSTIARAALQNLRHRPNARQTPGRVDLQSPTSFGATLAGPAASRNQDARVHSTSV